MDNVFIPGVPFDLDGREYEILKKKFPKDYQALLARTETLESSEDKFDDILKNCAFLD